MDRTEFIVATAILLFSAFCLGFVTHWIISRLSHVSKADLSELDGMAEALHTAEESRDSLKADKDALQAQLRERDSDLKTAVEELREARGYADELRSFISSQNMDQPR